MCARPKKKDEKTHSFLPQDLKVKIVRAIESGQLSVQQAKVKYDIKHSDTVRSWLFKYGKDPSAFVKKKLTEADRRKAANWSQGGKAGVKPRISRGECTHP